MTLNVWQIPNEDKQYAWTNQTWAGAMDDHVQALHNPVEPQAYLEPIKYSGKSEEDLSAFIDHTLLKPEATLDQITAVCEEAKLHQFKVRLACANGYGHHSLESSAHQIKELD
jgi:hypothetical protein